ncbi:MAG: zf-TFIIB domain-containing protein [Thermoleophilia bacterium]|nr:zf-TFIIB domain-containing protein [Thermoleophilia bacterium]
MSLRCRSCQVELVSETYEHQRIDSCPLCLGVFLGQDALASIARDDRIPRSASERLEAFRTATDRMADDSDVAICRCCACNGPMRRHIYAFSSGVVVDTCDRHGVWLDAGELQRIEAWSEAMRHGIDPDAAAAEASQVRPARIQPGMLAAALQVGRQLADSSR